jgi:hypothetical protein
MEDPASPGTIAAAQPKVIAGTPLCYTTGPSVPRVTLDKPLPPRGYTGEAVTGTVTFDFVPDQQYTTNKGPDWNWTSPEPWCTTFNQIYTDIVDCSRTFSVPAAEGKSVKISVPVFNGPSHPGTNAKDDQVGEGTFQIDFGKCGAETEACCGGPSCDLPNLSCNAQSTCVDCGTLGKNCCDTASACRASLACIAGKCSPCGTSGGPCCAGGACNSGLACNGATCGAPVPDLAASMSGTCPGSVTIVATNRGTAPTGTWIGSLTCGGLSVGTIGTLASVSPGGTPFTQTLPTWACPPGNLIIWAVTAQGDPNVSNDLAQFVCDGQVH